MVDDGLTTDDQQPTGDPPKQPEINIEEQLRESLQPFQQALQGLTAEVRDIREAASRQPEAKPEATHVTNDDLQTRLLTDPASVLKEHVDKGVKEALGPTMHMVLQDKRDSALSGFRAMVDKEFGDGTWEEHFKPDLDEAFRRLPTELQASNDNLNLMVNAIKGAKFSALQTRIEAARKAQAEAADQNPPRFLDGGHARPRDEETPPELKEWLVDYVKNTGDKSFTSKRWSELSTKGNTEDDWWPKEATQ